MIFLDLPMCKYYNSNYKDFQVRKISAKDLNFSGTNIYLIAEVLDKNHAL